MATMNGLRKIMLLCAMLPLAAQPASAAEPEIDIDLKKISDMACKDDIKKFCPDAVKGKESACLRERDKDLSMECKGARMAIDFLRKAGK